MNEEQREAAERLADELQRFDGAERESLRDEAAALLRELAAEPVQAPDLVRDFPAVKAAKKAAEAELGYYREMMAAEPVQEPVAAELPAPQLLVESAQGFVEGWTRSQVRSAINLALLKRRYAAPQQPMRCPEDGGECGAGGYCRPEPVQRKPLSADQIRDAVNDHAFWATSKNFIFRIARAIERAHGITGEPT